MDFFEHIGYSATRHNELTANYLYEIKLSNYYIDKIYETGKVETTSSVHFDIVEAPKYFKEMNAHIAEKCYEIKNTPVNDNCEVIRIGTIAYLDYAKDDIQRIYKENYDNLLNFTKRKMNTKYLNVNYMDNEDIVQQAFLKILDRKTTKPIYNLLPYIKTTITNLINDELREKQTVSHFIALSTDNMNSNDIYYESDGYGTYNNKDNMELSSIRKHYPETLYYHLIYGYTIRETANEFNISERSIKYELDSFKKTFQKKLKIQK